MRVKRYILIILAVLAFALLSFLTLTAAQLADLATSAIIHTCREAKDELGSN